MNNGCFKGTVPENKFELKGRIRLKKEKATVKRIAEKDYSKSHHKEKG